MVLWRVLGFELVVCSLYFELIRENMHHVIKC